MVLNAQYISHHVNTIYKEGELFPEATVKKYLSVRLEGKREVKRLLDYYNLDMTSKVDVRKMVYPAVNEVLKYWERGE
ncbi:MAG: hypothetical protein L3J71_10580 [Victivallaceae bacterium]|nr:hypothetical protein [Victivallaceae bacterium]